MQGITTSAGRRHIVWSTKPFYGRRGVYVGLLLESDELFVAVRRNGAPRWIPAQTALTDAEAQAWRATGFARRN